MDKIAKHSTSILVFIINILLAAVGYLLIKNNDDQKRLSEQQSNPVVTPISENSAISPQAALPVINSVPSAGVSPLSNPTPAPQAAPKPTTTTRTS